MRMKAEHRAAPQGFRPPVFQFDFRIVVFSQFHVMFSPRNRGLVRLWTMRLSLSCLIVAVLVLETACWRRSEFYSQVTFEYVAPPGMKAKAAIQALLPKGDSSVTLTQQKNTALYEIGVYDPVAQKAADRANALAATIRTKLENEAGGAKFKIWQRAQPGLYPER